jgi:IS605 OrfB family transposase
MKLISQVQLRPNKEQILALRKTIEEANHACDQLSELAFTQKTFRQFNLHKTAYHPVRRKFPLLSSQMIVRCIAKVADAYKLDCKVQRKFKPLGSISYDVRILSWKAKEDACSIWTINGRQKIPFVCGDRQRELLRLPRGEADLVLRDGKFYLFITVTVPETEVPPVSDYIGVDLGLVVLAATSDGKLFGGGKVSDLRRRYFRIRRRLQSKGTKSAKRLLKKRRRKESLFSRDVNHCISKVIVSDAKAAGKGIALENLKNIRSRITARKERRRDLHSWAFQDLQGKLAYKAKLSGVAIKFVPAFYTSQECSVCGHTAKANRKTRGDFKCEKCGHTDHADTNGAQVIRKRALHPAVVTPPNADRVRCSKTIH